MFLKLRNWIVRHPFLALLTALVLLGIFLDEAEPGELASDHNADMVTVLVFWLFWCVVLTWAFDRKGRSKRILDDQRSRRDYVSSNKATVDPPTPSYVVQLSEQTQERMNNEDRIARDLEEAKARWERDGYRKNRPNHDTFLDQQPAYSNAPLPPVVEQPRGSNVTLKELIRYTPTEFEEFCARALNAMGYKEMTRNGGAGDLQADVIGKDSHGRSTIVQCKRYKPGSKVGTPVIQTFIGMMNVHHRAERGIFMTTADYSEPAKRLAQQHNIVLIDGDDLVKIAGLVFAPRVEARPKYQVKFCSSCGSEIESHEVRYCAECGNPIQRPST